MEPARKESNSFVWFIQRFPFAQYLSPKERTWLEERMTTKTYGRGEKIYTPMKNNTRLYFIRSGLVKISALSEGGRELAMEVLGPGDVFGSIPGARGEAAGYAEAIEESVVSSIDSAEFAHILSSRPEMCSYFVQLLGEKTEQARRRLEDVVFLDVMGRIAKIILELAEKVGAIKEGSNTTSFAISLTHKDLAGMAATTRETTTSVLGKLKKMNIAEMDRGQVTIHDIEKLKSLIVEM